MTRLKSRAARLLPFAALLAFSACTSLPPRGEVPEVRSIADGAGTSLGRLAAASLAPLGGAPSGLRLLPSPGHAWDAREQLLRRAERSIDAQCYHISNDSVGLNFLRELRSAAARGVRVRLLLDDLYTGEIRDELLALALEPGVEVRLFNPLPVRAGGHASRLLRSFHDFRRVNHRMHNKLLVIDASIALFGGRNVGDEYFVRHDAANYIDLDLIGAGDVVRQLSGSFDAYWNSLEVWPLQQVEPTLGDAPARRAAFEQRLASVAPLAPRAADARDALGQASVSRQIAEQQRLNLVAARAEVHADPPDKRIQLAADGDLAGAATRAKVKVIAEARQRVVMVSPYFLPGSLGMRLIERGQRSGVEGFVFTNSLGSTDEPLVHRAYSRYRADLVRLGIQLFEVSPTVTQQAGELTGFGATQGRLHAKAASVDNRWLLVGSVNMDPRSARLNTELGVVIDSPPLAQAFARFMSPELLGGLYKVELEPKSGLLRWLSRVHGQTVTYEEEPHNSWWLQFKLWLQALFVGEDML